MNEAPLKQPDSRRVAAYARVSTAMQSTGLEAQVRAIRTFCEQNNITNYQVFQDENQSGTKSSRPALDDMMAAVRRGEISTIIVFSFSRFARSTTHLLSALAEFKKANVAFKSISERIDTESALGMAFFTILAALAQLERDLIAERVKCGLANARAKGKLIGRKKTRNSLLIRALLEKKLPYRMVAELANCSHGSIYSEVQSLKKEQAALKAKQDEELLPAKEILATPETKFPDLALETPPPELK